jgi:hypothetical protein
MSYWIKVFCTEGEAPQLGSLLDWARKLGVELSGGPSDAGFTHAELARRHWEGLALWYLPDRGHLEFHMSSFNDPGSRLAGLIQEFREEVAALDPSDEREEVLAHLDRTRFVVSLNLPVSGFDTEELWTATWVLVDYFLEMRGGLLHVDGEGFYKSSNRQVLLLALD